MRSAMASPDVPREHDGESEGRGSKRSLSGALEALPQMDIAQLRRHFARAYGKEAPVSFSRQLLIYAVAYRLQAQAFGGLRAATHKQLLALAQGGNPTPKHTPPRSGVRLIREWRGLVHEVQVQENGVLWNGETYRSLSVVARAITGTHCSGPRFFGLRRPPSPSSEGEGWGEGGRKKAAP